MSKYFVSITWDIKVTKKRSLLPRSWYCRRKCLEIYKYYKNARWNKRRILEKWKHEGMLKEGGSLSGCLQKAWPEGRCFRQHWQAGLKRGNGVSVMSTDKEWPQIHQLSCLTEEEICRKKTEHWSWKGQFSLAGFSQETGYEWIKQFLLVLAIYLQPFYFMPGPHCQTLESYMLHSFASQDG